MKKKYLKFLPLLLILFQQNGFSQEHYKYFEGEVTFTSEFESLDPQIPDDYWHYVFGNSLVGVVKEYKYKTITISESEGTTITYYDLREKKVYIESSMSDTVKWYPLDEEPGELISIQRNKAEKKYLFDELRESVTLEYIPDDPYVERIVSTHYFMPEHKLNKKVYAEHKLNFWHLFINESGSISIRNEAFVYPFLKRVDQVTNIDERVVDDSELEFDKSKVLVKGETGY
ncbi:MAG: hypothetical protein RLN81_16995 [Balneolaceae bacterium]